jgi:Imm-5 like putative immunity protein
LPGPTADAGDHGRRVRDRADADLVEDPGHVQKDDAMPDDSATIELSLRELREVAGYAAACARPALAIFERERPGDRRPRAAIDAAQAFAEGAERTRTLRDSAWAAQRAAQEARDAGQAAASDAARAALAAAGAAFLHPLAKATQVKHILGSAAHTARAFELAAGDDPATGADRIAQARTLAPPLVVEVLRRYPAAPRGGGRIGELIRQLDAALR